MDSSNNHKGMTMIITLVVALAIGGGVGYAAGHSSSNDGNDSMTKADSSMSVDGVTVGGAKMVQTKDIVDNAVNAKNVTTTVAAVKAAGLVDTLKSEGPFTVFAPNNDAFNKLPAGTVDTLLKPENKDMLTKILTYHVVPGTYTSADLKVMASKGQTLMTVQGDVLTPVMVDNKVALKDSKGNEIAIETADVISSNGVSHVITSVMMPN